LDETYVDKSSFRSLAIHLMVLICRLTHTVKCEGVANSYPKYVHFIHPLDTRKSSRIGKMFSSSQEVTIISRDLSLFGFNLLHVAVAQ